MISRASWNSTALIVVLVFLIEPVLCQGVRDGERPDVEIAVRLSVGKNTFRVGEPISIEVRITNTGRFDVFVGRRVVHYTEWTYTLKMALRDQMNRVSPQWVGAPPFVIPGRELSFWEALYRDWILLPPGYSYVKTLEIDKDTFEFLGRPGRYTIDGLYISKGMDAPYYYNRLQREPEKIAALPYKAWKGSVKTNQVEIDILAANAEETERKQY